MNETAACLPFCVLLALSSLLSALRQEGPYDPTSQWQRELQRKGLEGKTTTLHLYHTFLYVSLPLLQDYEPGSV